MRAQWASQFSAVTQTTDESAESYFGSQPFEEIARSENKIERHIPRLIPLAFVAHQRAAA
jgi:hypothetical protein